MTDQELNSSSPPALPSNTSDDQRRFTLIASVGIMGTEEDCVKFMNLMVADFQVRCEKANEKIMRGRITLLPVEETIPREV